MGQSFALLTSGGEVGCSIHDAGVNILFWVHDRSLRIMFNWYNKAVIFYVYLSDVIDIGKMEDICVALRGSRWFTRGWTLQELIAPSNVVFFTQKWEDIGSKSELTSVLAKITGINELALSDPDVRGFSIAQRMSGASQRVATRSEDAAYCLMDIFDVNMPLRYGEGTTPTSSSSRTSPSGKTSDWAK